MSSGLAQSRLQLACHNRIDASLKRLKTSYVDIYWIHRFDPETPIEETMKALHDVVESGKVCFPLVVFVNSCWVTGSLHWRELHVDLPGVPELRHPYFMAIWAALSS